MGAAGARAAESDGPPLYANSAQSEFNRFIGVGYHIWVISPPFVGDNFYSD
jgi:hypothetical protein